MAKASKEIPISKDSKRSYLEENKLMLKKLRISSNVGRNSGIYRMFIILMEGLIGIFYIFTFDKGIG